MAHIENHTLYMTNTCPYCIRVLRFMEDAGITMEMRNIAQPEYAAELVAIGGKRQVPCLVIDGKAMYESADIIAYLKKNYA
ncbi:MAG: glutaredoxin [Eggerthellaceae bacterium]|nr:glutaredoxin [Eggerthellaceae bacterium]